MKAVKRMKKNRQTPDRFFCNDDTESFFLFFFLFELIFHDLGIVALENENLKFSCFSLFDRRLFLERAHTEHFPHTHIHIHRDGHFTIALFLHIFEFDEISTSLKLSLKHKFFVKLKLL